MRARTRNQTHRHVRRETHAHFREPNFARHRCWRNDLGEKERHQNHGFLYSTRDTSKRKKKREKLLMEKTFPVGAISRAEQIQLTPTSNISHARTHDLSQNKYIPLQEENKSRELVHGENFRGRRRNTRRREAYLCRRQRRGNNDLWRRLCNDNGRTTPIDHVSRTAPAQDLSQNMYPNLQR